LAIIFCLKAIAIGSGDLKTLVSGSD